METYKRYDTTIDKVKDMLTEYGVAVIPNVMSKEECIVNRELAWKEFYELTKNMSNPITKDDPSTYATLYDLFPLHSMLLQHFGVGHMQWTWNVRQHPKVVEVFAKIWGTDDLITSFDGVSLHLPPEITKRGWYRGNDWLHTDQSPSKKGLTCVQGLVNMYPTRKGDATLCLIEKSHHQHEDFFKFCATPDSKDDWYRLASDEERYFLTGELHRVEFGEGDLVLWDSRLFHQGSEPIRGRAEPNTRMVSYVCMTPRKWCTSAKQKRRREIFEEGRVTSHWPHLPKMFPKTPRTYGNTIPDIVYPSKPTLTELGKSLI